MGGQTPEQLALIAAVLLLVAVVASKVSSRTGIPVLLLFLGIGMLAGSDGPGGIWFDNAWVAQTLGVVALALILFAGGLETDWRRVRPALPAAISLASLGVVLTAAVVGVAAKLLLGFNWLEGLLIGAIVSSTDAAAVFAVLRGQRIALKGSLQPLLELESGWNDPMAVFLTVAFTTLLSKPDTATPAAVMAMFFLQMPVGGAVGWMSGRMAAAGINRLRLDSEGLYPAATVAAALLAYGGAALLHGSGFLAVYVAGLVLGNHEFLHKRSLVRFHNGLAWLMQITMFLALGLLVFPKRLLPVAPQSLLIAAVLVLAARPLSVFVALAASRFHVRQKLLVSWVGLRGAVPIVLATYPLLAGLAKADLFFDIVFFTVITSVLIQGTTIGLVTRWLDLQSDTPPKSGPAMELAPVSRGAGELVELVLDPLSPAVGRSIMELGLPRSALVTLVTRGEEYFAPHGGTVLQTGDTLMVLADRGELAEVRRRLEGSTGY